MRLRCIIDKDDLPKLIKGEELTLTNDKISAVTIEVNGAVTNGDVIKAMFPNQLVIHEDCNGAKYIVKSKEWWNSPYKESESE